MTTFELKLKEVNSSDIYLDAKENSHYFLFVVLM